MFEEYTTSLGNVDFIEKKRWKV
ncbi:Protein of unknown function [Bacillus cytotoxicus]|uniref:Uncharacterized protein n=1 Tax=Bacillus cytotoxicus TaxID=580165 RepID=A0AAX2CNX1_9BACI|nr:Protein of unknown function [Bacillus cytotoxicus]SCN43003.1 Protein of unknown function [Bacillus cytotoxicus]